MAKHGHVTVLLVSWKADDRSRQCPNERSCTETILSYTTQYYAIQYCSVLHEYFQQETTQSGLPIFPPVFPFEQKRRKHVQGAWVKGTVLKKGLNKEGALCWKRCLLYHRFLDSAISPFSE